MAVGVFDGVHLGHRALLSRLRQEADGMHAKTAVLTFKRNPRRMAQGGGYPGDVQSLEQKIESLEAEGVQAVVLADFHPPFTELSGMDFLEELKARFGVECLVMGENTRMGAGGGLHSQEAAGAARSLGLGAAIVGVVTLKGRSVSSSLIRSCILAGKMDEAATLLGRPWELDASAWEKPSVLLRRTTEPLQALPPSGRYAFAAPDGITGVLDFRRLEGGAEMRGEGVKALPDRLCFV